MIKERTNRRARIKTLAAKTFVLLAAFGLFAFNHAEPMTQLRQMPEAVFAQSEAELYDKLGQYSAGSLVAAASSDDESLNGRQVALRLPFGLTVGSVRAFVGSRPRLTPGGEPVGVSIYTEGVLVVGLSEFRDDSGRKASPAAEAGVRPGDVIRSVGGAAVSSADELSKALESCPEAELVIERAGRRIGLTVRARRDEYGAVKMGAWVRDSTIGVGTLSFIDPEGGIAAALGHAVLDPDTGALLAVRDGRLVSANILGVTKGRQGAPGELHGNFSSESPYIARVTANTGLGIFGRLEAGAACPVSGEPIETAFPDEVKRGPAVILCAASGRVEEYSCVIRFAERQSEPAPKGLVIEVTDERLIELTGGVVQGMSGSPIIQDGRLVGAVTHVFVNDPLKGYGAYAYWMYMKARDEG